MNFTEQAILFSCGREKLLGIIACPEQVNKTGVVIVVGGPQTHIGSHRQFLLLSRALAEAGYPVMRFDYTGMGDSTGDLGCFDSINEDIAASIDAFQVNCPQIERVVLWGLCDAAAANLLYWDSVKDSRLYGLILLNPWVRSQATLARTHIKHYYGQRLLELEFWRKFLTGNLDISRALGGVFKNLLHMLSASRLSSTDQVLPFQKRMVRALAGFSGPILLILSGDDYTAKEFSECIKLDPLGSSVLREGRLTQIDIEGADHTFSSLKWRAEVENLTIQWLKSKLDQ